MIPEMLWKDLVVGTKERETLWSWRISYNMAIDGYANCLVAVTNSIKVVEKSVALVLKGNPYNISFIVLSHCED